MSKLILVVGPQHSGKTALSQKIATETGITYLSWKDIGLSGFVSKVKNLKPHETAIIDDVVTNSGLFKKFLHILNTEKIQIESIIRLNISYDAYCEYRQNGNGATDDKKTCKKEYDQYLEFCSENYELIKKRANEIYELNGCKTIVSMFADYISKSSRKSTSNFPLYERVAETILTTEFGDFGLIAYQHKINYYVHLALTKGKVSGKRNVPLRVHSSCITGDIFHSKHCDCMEQLHHSLHYISDNGLGVVLYLFQEGRGINIINKIKAYALQRKGMDTLEANTSLGMPPELRKYDSVKSITDDLGIVSIDLMSNNPDKISKLLDEGVLIEHRIPVIIDPNKFNKKYLKDKQKKFGHILNIS